jgi:hypothetical protein
MTGNPAYRVWKEVRFSQPQAGQAFDRELQPVSDIGPEAPENDLCYRQERVEPTILIRLAFKKPS